MATQYKDIRRNILLSSFYKESFKKIQKMNMMSSNLFDWWRKGLARVAICNWGIWILKNTRGGYRCMEYDESKIKNLSTVFKWPPSLSIHLSPSFEGTVVGVFISEHWIWIGLGSMERDSHYKMFQPGENVYSNYSRM